MNSGKLVDLDKLQRIMEEMLGVFQKNDLNDVEMTLVISELDRVNKDYAVIQNRKNESKDL